jgi:hypothetical protein
MVRTAGFAVVAWAAQDGPVVAPVGVAAAVLLLLLLLPAVME